MSIIQFSPGRSGSTLIWNILKEFYPNVLKVHNLRYSPNAKFISTIRDPRDILKSRLLIYEKPITHENIDIEINLMIKHGLQDLLIIKGKTNVLVLKYENFWNNYDYIFDHLEQFLNINI